MSLRDILRARFDGTFIKKAANFSLWFFCFLLLYTLSLGPTLKLAEAKTPAGKMALPQWIEVTYYPLLHSNFGPLNEAYDRYLKLWIVFE